MKSTLEKAREIRDLMEDDLVENMTIKESAAASDEATIIKRSFLNGYICCLNSYLCWIKDLIESAEKEQKKTARIN